MKKGFTLIELIVVMAIISILVLLGVPKYKGYVEEARVTKLIVETKELERASQQYYIRNSDWPRLSNEAYTFEEVAAFGEKIYNSTGKIVELEENGNYYDIDYNKLKNYISKPDKPENYILQNPVGNVYSIEGITHEAKVRIPEGNETVEIPEEPEIPVTPIVFKGLSSEAFDKDNITKTTVLGDITWDGNLDNKKVILDLAGGVPGYPIWFKIYDSNNNQLNFINLTTNIEVNVISQHNRSVTEIIVPEGAVRFNLSKVGSTGGIHDIYVSDNLESPESIYDITSISTDSSITLSWKQDDSNYEKVALYRDGVFLALVSGKTYIDKPLYSATEHTYSLKAINSYGNGSLGLVNYTTSTLTPEIEFKGSTAEAFDKDNTTKTTVLGDITWIGNLDNKKVILDLTGGAAGYPVGFKIYDSNNNQLNFINLTTNTEVSGISQHNRSVTEIIVPEGAVRFNLSKVGSTGGIYDIYVSGNLETPKPVYNITSSSTDSSITLTWKQDDINYEKVAIYRDGKLVGITTEKSFTDKPLYSATEHTYSLKAINSYGNASTGVVSYIASTNTPEIVFRGLSPAVFDKDNTTKITTLGDVTWTGNLSSKKVTIDLQGVTAYPVYFRIYDSNNNILDFTNLTTNTVVSSLAPQNRRITEIIVPEGAVRFNLSKVGNTGGVYSIYVSD